MKRKPKSMFISKMDSLVSRIVRERDKFCVTCGTSENLTCSHWIPRRFFGSRWDLRNCNAQCFACNVAHSNDAVGTPIGEAYGVYMREHYGSGVMVELLYSKPKKVRVYEFESIYQSLKEIAEEMGVRV